MTAPRAMGRARTLRIAGLALAGIGLCLVLVALLARAATRVQDHDVLAAIVAVLVLLLSVAGLIGGLVLMYALYATLRGPRPHDDTGGG